MLQGIGANLAGHTDGGTDRCADKYRCWNSYFDKTLRSRYIMSFWMLETFQSDEYILLKIDNFRLSI